MRTGGKSKHQKRPYAWTRIRLIIRRLAPGLLFRGPRSERESRGRGFILLSVLSIPVTIVFVPINYKLDPVGILSVVDIVAGIALTLNLFFFARHGRPEIAAAVSIALMAALIIFAGVRVGSLYYFWMLVLMPISYFLLGTGYGTWSCLVLLSGMGAAFVLFPEANRDPSLSIHLPLSSIAMACFGYAGERVREEYGARLLSLSTRDSMTGIYNRRHIQDIGRREIMKYRRYGRPLSLLIFDIDHFKKVNDRLGHQAGDEVLMDVAATVRDSLRDTDYFARWGGEEFLIIAPETGAADLEILAERLRGIVAEKKTRTNAPISISLGGTSLSAADSFAQALARADRALYRAKHSGRDAAFFEHADGSRSSRRGKRSRSKKTIAKPRTRK